MPGLTMEGDGRRLAAALCLVIVATASVAPAQLVVVKNSIWVMSPLSMRAHHEAAIANYGVPNYGGTLTGVVLYPADAKLATGCRPFDATAPFKSRSGRPVVLLVDRGECYFAVKTWNAQQAGAAAVLVADNFEEPLLTMDNPEGETLTFLANITAPSALVTKSFGDALRIAASKSGEEEVVVQLDWRESMPHPDARVEYEFWSNINDECGPRCDEQAAFVSAFRGHAQLLEKAGDALFTPHYIIRFCPARFAGTRQCASECINHGRYCAPDPEGDLGAGYEGRDVVVENLRQLCVHRVANARNASWVWWDFVTDYRVRCSMREKKYSRGCAEEVVASLGLPAEMMAECMGDPEADADNEVLKTEQMVQVGQGNRGNVTVSPTLVINNVQYRGKLESTAVLKAICAGFKETTEPRVCLTQDMETDECLDNNGGCWRDDKTNITACKDTYRGRVCECPMVEGVKYEGYGYNDCKASAR
ncbi:hypothetical protein QYE76_047948 [Lolium multiflorum]|uniref:PA domain-containing protein n=1 Tax=Lolium multiflorum TaxID=4521 RepID=A0AAD8TQU2_LOLMU|nr:hypothetical protein QYE76_047948 [Lolium multiflorum]